MFRNILLPSLIVILLMNNGLTAANKAAVENAIKKGVEFMSGEIGELKGGEKTFIALAMIKGKAPITYPPIQEVINDILGRCQGGKYTPDGEHLYVAGVEATLLADVDPAKYQPQIKLIADYIIGLQMDTGGWDYPNGGHGADSVGDTSVMQYACLGLWAAERAAIDIDPKVWKKVMDWHVKYQNQDGGFSYCPGLKTGDGNGASMLNMSVNAVGTYHIAMLHIDPTLLPLKDDARSEKPKEETPPEPPKFGVLESVKIENPLAQPDENIRVTSSAVNGVRRAFNFVKTRFSTENKETGWSAYYYYSLERMAALADIEMIGSQNWFDVVSNHVIRTQQGDGSWKISKNFEPVMDTAFVVLFLTRSTGKLLKRVDPPPQFGDGLLAGGRGLPDDLSNAQFDGRRMKEKKKPTEPLDILLDSLSKTGGLANLDDVQEQIVEQVQLGDKKDLVGQVDQLLKLVDHPDPGIRQTVVWALGRTGDFSLAQHLIRKLSDEDLAVMIEARNALCWISRKPLGFGFAEDPVEDLPPNATGEQVTAAISQWHKNLVLSWGEWYLTNRPFEDRGDAFEAELRRKMEKLKYGF